MDPSWANYYLATFGYPEGYDVAVPYVAEAPVPEDVLTVPVRQTKRYYYLFNIHNTHISEKQEKAMELLQRLHFAPKPAKNRVNIPFDHILQTEFIDVLYSLVKESKAFKKYIQDWTSLISRQVLKVCIVSFCYLTLLVIILMFLPFFGLFEWTLYCLIYSWVQVAFIVIVLPKIIFRCGQTAID